MKATVEERVETVERVVKEEQSVLSISLNMSLEDARDLKDFLGKTRQMSHDPRVITVTPYATEEEAHRIDRDLLYALFSEVMDAVVAADKKVAAKKK